MGEARSEGDAQDDAPEGASDPGGRERPGHDQPEQDEAPRGHDEARPTEDDEEDVELPPPFSSL